MDALEVFQRTATLKLLEIEDYVKAAGLLSIEKFTLVARDPSNPEMFVVITNEENIMEIVPLLKKDKNP